jgi:voltage-gated potassium channel
MRVVRAFRLARRFEAVIIIMRSQRKSLRALYVLVLNLLIGMLFFGALMYSAEQGTWNPETSAWERLSYGEPEKNPFDSIPACFWWAIVTATTVGYGDTFTPRTPPGKAVAALTMVWSVCVLALPIGVIGGNFIQVWE